MTQVQIARDFAADPASVALLLAGPSAQALWPTTYDDDQPVVSVGSPMRAGIGFVVDLTVTGSTAGTLRSRLSLVPDADRTAAGSTHARMVLTSATSTAADLRDRGARFLEALSSLAEARSTAA